MEIRNNAEALKAFLGVSSPATAETQASRSAEAKVHGAPDAFAGDRANLSQVGTEVSQQVSADFGRMEKVKAIQQAVAAGSYSVPTGKVADRVIDTMLPGGIASEK